MEPEPPVPVSSTNPDFRRTKSESQGVSSFFGLTSAAETISAPHVTHKDFAPSGVPPFILILTILSLPRSVVAVRFMTRPALRINLNCQELSELNGKESMACRAHWSANVLQRRVIDHPLNSCRKPKNRNADKVMAAGSVRTQASNRLRTRCSSATPTNWPASCPRPRTTARASY